MARGTALAALVAPAGLPFKAVLPCVDAYDDVGL